MQNKTERNVGFKSANQQFKNFLEESGQANISKDEKTSLFKNWLQDAIQAGTLQDFTDKVKQDLNNASPAATTDNTPATPPKPFRPLGMHPLAAAGTVIIVGSLLVYGVIQLVKYVNKPKTATA